MRPMRQNLNQRIARIFLGTLLSVGGLQADVKLPALFSDHMVLQQGKLLPVWGWADEGEKVTVEFRGKIQAAYTKDGKWKVLLPKSSAGGPFNLTVNGKNEITINEVLVGEVWLCSGQSNMEGPMRASFEPEKDIANSRNDKLRLFTVPKLKANEPVQDVKASWVESGPETVSNFTAVGYYFGRDLQKALDVPGGMIHTSWGGSPAEVWLREGVLEENSQYKAEILEEYKTSMEKAKDDIAKWEAD